MLRQIFIDLDETLIHSADPKTVCVTSLSGRFKAIEHSNYVTFLRPDAHEFLDICRTRAKQVFLFTFAERDYTWEICSGFSLGFKSDEILTCESMLLKPKNLAPKSVLIDDRAPDHSNAVFKMQTLGIDATRYLTIPAFDAPKFASCGRFMLGLPQRLAWLSRRIVMA